MTGYSQKTVYALRAIFELAKRFNEGPISIAILADTQAIPPRFLENILLQLKQVGIVESVRGKVGGYMLARPPAEISVGDVLRAAEGQISPVSCLNGKTQDSCPMRDDCVFLPMWHRAESAMLEVYDGTSFEDLLEESNRRRMETYVPNYSI